MLIAPRNDDGSLPYSTFARIKDESFLIDKGTPVEATLYRGIEVEGIAYNGTAPDLGAYEKETGTTGIKSTVATEETNNLRITTTMGGRVMLTVCNASGTQHFKAFVPYAC